MPVAPTAQPSAVVYIACGRYSGTRIEAKATLEVLQKGVITTKRRQTTIEAPDDEHVVLLQTLGLMNRRKGHLATVSSSQEGRVPSTTLFASSLHTYPRRCARQTQLTRL